MTEEKKTTAKKTAAKTTAKKVAPAKKTTKTAKIIPISIKITIIAYMIIEII